MATLLDGTEGSTEAPPRRVRGTPRALVAASELAWRLIICLVAVAILAWALWQVRVVFVPAFVALLVSTILAPPAQALARAGLPRGLAAAIVFVGGLALIGGVIALIVPQLAGEFGQLGRQVELGAQQVGDYVASGPFGLSDAQVQAAIDDAADRVRRSAGSLATGVLTGAIIVTQVLAELLLTLVLLFFFVKDGPQLWAWVLRLFPRHRRETVHHVGQASLAMLTGYVRGVFFVACVDAFFIGIALALIGVPLVIPLAVITFIAAFIPFVGAFVAGAVATLVALVSGGVIDALLVLAAVLVVQQLEGNLLYPVVVGRSVELHPVAILLAVGTGAVLAGIVGAFIAVPITAAIAAAIPVARRETEEDARREEIVVAPTRAPA
jgi:predicted PurR-regulated permease PerM